MSVTVEPRAALFTPNTLGIVSLRMKNGKEINLAVKITCSDNTIYRCKPVYAVLKPGQEVLLDIARTASPAKLDRLIVHSLQLPGNTIIPVTDVEDLYKVSPNPIRLQINLVSAANFDSVPQAAGGANACAITEEEIRKLGEPPQAA